MAFVEMLDCFLDGFGPAGMFFRGTRPGAPTQVFADDYAEDYVCLPERNFADPLPLTLTEKWALGAWLSWIGFTRAAVVVTSEQPENWRIKNMISIANPAPSHEMGQR